MCRFWLILSNEIFIKAKSLRCYNVQECQDTTNVVVCSRKRVVLKDGNYILPGFVYGFGTVSRMFLIYSVVCSVFTCDIFIIQKVC